MDGILNTNPIYQAEEDCEEEKLNQRQIQEIYWRNSKKGSTS